MKRCHFVGKFAIVACLAFGLAHAVLSAPVSFRMVTERPPSASERVSGSTAERFIIMQLWDDLSYLASEPDFYIVVGGLGFAPTLFASPMRHESPEITELWGQSIFADHLFEAGETVGDGVFPVLTSAASWSIGMLSGSVRLRKFGTDLLRAQVMTGIMTTALKRGINRSRPDGAPYSYPSGHTACAFATAGTVHAHFGRTWGILAYVLAGYVGFSRLQEGKHFLSDIAAGGVLGSYVSLKLAGRGNNRGLVSVSPAKMGDGLGLSLSLRF